MIEPTFCETVNTNKIQKYRNLIPKNDKHDNKYDNIKKQTVKFNNVDNPMWSGPVKQFSDEIKCPEKNLCSEILNTSNEEITECCPVTTPVTTSDNCSLPLARWTELAQKTGTRPAVDKHTISRYSPAEWKLYNEKFSKEANEAVQDAENLMFNEKLIYGQVYIPVDVNQAENETRIQHRAQIVFNWKVELEKKNCEFTDELHMIQKIIQQLMHCNHNVDFIINIDRDMKNVRNMRLPPDLVHDDVTNEIIKEDALCAEVMNLNTRYIDEVKKQLKELKDAKRRLEHDWSDKKCAYDIDTACLSLKSSSPTIQWKPGCAHLPDGQSTPAGHEYAVKETLIFIQAALTRSRIMRENVKDSIKKSAKDLRVQANHVDMALMRNIDKTFQDQKKLERGLNKCLKSLTYIENIFEKINGAVRKLDGPMKCAQTRLSMRLGRENVENCRDVPQFGLIDEVKNISESVSALMSQIKGAEKSVEALTRSRQKIEQEIEVKQKTMWVDNERCKYLRSFYPTDQALCGYQ